MSGFKRMNKLQEFAYFDINITYILFDFNTQKHLLQGN